MNDKRVALHGEISRLLSDVAGQLAVFLERVLPPLFDDWWNKAVVNTLSFQQKRRLEQRNITSLSGLDLAGLLRVLDQNWYQISNSLDLTSEARHFVKEMQTVRNHWAHADTEGFPVDDIYRDLDTLQRFAVVIGADDKLIQDLRKQRRLFSRRRPSRNLTQAQRRPPRLRKGKTMRPNSNPGKSSSPNQTHQAVALWLPCWPESLRTDSRSS